MRSLRYLVLAALCLAPIEVSSSTAAAAGAVRAEAPRAIDFTLKDLAGKAHSLKAEKGRVVVLNFWATWCGPCRVELPRLKEIYDKLKSEPLTVYAVSVDNEQTVRGVKSVVTSQGFKFDVLLDTDNAVVGRYNPEGIIPFTVLIDHKGNVQHVHKGYNPGDERLVEQELREMLKVASSERSSTRAPTKKKK